MSETITLEEYSEKSIVLRGIQTANYKNKLVSMNGKWNPHLKGGAGWIFSKRHLSDLRNFIEEYNKHLTIKQPITSSVIQTIENIPSITPLAKRKVINIDTPDKLDKQSKRKIARVHTPENNKNDTCVTQVDTPENNKNDTCVTQVDTPKLEKLLKKHLKEYINIKLNSILVEYTKKQSNNLNINFIFIGILLVLFIYFFECIFSSIPTSRLSTLVTNLLHDLSSSRISRLVKVLLGDLF